MSAAPASGLTKIGQDILDFADSGMAPDLIATVLRVPADIVRLTIRAYAGSTDHRDVLDELTPDRLPVSATVAGRL